MAGINDPGYSRSAEFFLPIAASAFQRFANCGNDRFMHAVWVAEPDFAFGRMHVHVDRCGIEMQKEKRDRELAFHERGVIAFAQSGRNERAFHRAAIDKDKLLGAGLAADAGLADEANHLRRGPSRTDSWR